MQTPASDGAPETRESGVEPDHPDEGFELRLLRIVQSIRLDQLAADACDLLAQAGVPHAVIKGVSTARWLYDPPREYRDVDLLVPGSRIADAVRALSSLATASTGAFGEEAAHSQVLISADGAELDLHATLPAASVDRRDPDRVWRVLGPHVESFDVDGRTIPVLDLPGRCVVLALHVIASGFESQQVREDLRRARAATSDAQWAEAQQMAVALGLADWFGAAIAFVEGRSIAVAPTEVRLRLRGGPATAIQMARLAGMPLRYTIVALANELWPTKQFMLRYDPTSGGSSTALLISRLRRMVRHGRVAVKLLVRGS